MRQRGCWAGMQRRKRGTVCGERRGRQSVREAEAPLEASVLWVWGCETWGAGFEARGRWRGSGVEQKAAGRWVELRTPLDIGEEASLEVVVGATLELAGEQEQTGWARTGKGVTSSRRGRGFD